MSLIKQNILSIGITNNSVQEILEEMEKYLNGKRQNGQNNTRNIAKIITIVTPNPEQIVAAQKDTHFAQLLKKADVALPDGTGIVWASRILSEKPLSGRIPGIEFMEMLVRHCFERGYGIGLIGGTDKVAIKALECLQKKHPGLVGCAQDGPDVRISNFKFLISNNATSTEEFFVDLARKIKQNTVRVVFVGMGAPKQEYVIEKLKKQLSITKYHIPIILMSVGGAFDMISGKIPRAPFVMRFLGIEWFWRLLLEPKRIRRQLALLTFIRLVVQNRLSV